MSKIIRSCVLGVFAAAAISAASVAPAAAACVLRSGGFWDRRFNIFMCEGPLTMGNGAWEEATKCGETPGRRELKSAYTAIGILFDESRPIKLAVPFSEFPVPIPAKV